MLTSMVGPSGLVLFRKSNHGLYLRIKGKSRKAMQYLIGNPLFAIEMTEHAIGAALYAPLRILLYEIAGDKTFIEYDLPSSLFGQFDDEHVDRVAKSLDRKLDALIAVAALIRPHHEPVLLDIDLAHRSQVARTVACCLIGDYQSASPNVTDSVALNAKEKDNGKWQLLWVEFAFIVARASVARQRTRLPPLHSALTASAKRRHSLQRRPRRSYGYSRRRSTRSGRRSDWLYASSDDRRRTRHRTLTELVVVESMHERKRRMAAYRMDLPRYPAESARWKKSLKP